MSFVEEIHEKLPARLRELEPAHREYEELRDYAERLSIDYTPADEKPAAAPATKPAAKRAAKKPAKTKRAARAKATTNGNGNGHHGTVDRRALFLAEIQGRPGITIKEAAENMGIGDTSLYKHRAALVDDGLIETKGPNLFPKGFDAALGTGGAGAESTETGGHRTLY